MKPVASWIKRARIVSGVGYEFTIILRTCACRWARSSSGGCSMCGYFNDKAPNTITEQEIFNQFKFALEKHANELKQILSEKKLKSTIKSDNKKTLSNDIALKIFTSGSFLDEEEISPVLREKIFKEIAKLDCIKEVVVESRPEFINKEKILQIKNVIPNKIFEVGIGLESANKFVREILINKGFTIESVKSAINILHMENSRAKIYLLFKPPFLNEKNAIKDLVVSINESIKMNADTISINPTCIQKFTLTNLLYLQKQFRPPWFYSLFEAFQKSLSNQNQSKTLILCAPMSMGKEKGIHNCSDKECNERWSIILEKFVNTQDINIIHESNLPYEACKCWFEYNLFKEMY
ncbi:MAG: archaeosine biosynthesis radical SAM protein RaSEA [Promethearchaeota archaeon]